MRLKKRHLLRSRVIPKFYVKEQGRLYRFNGLNVLHLRGTSAEMAYQHGSLLKSEISQGAVPHLSHRIYELIQHSYLAHDFPWIMPLVHSFLRAAQSGLKSKTPLEYRQERKALSLATGIPERTFEQASLQPDTLLFLLRLAVGSKLLHQDRLGCTSICVFPEASASSELIMGRNMDYPALGYWDQFPTVLYFDPTSGKDIPHTSITSAGIHTAGVSGFNQEGLSLALHFHCSRQQGFSGTPIHILGTEILKTCRTLEDVEKLLSRSATTGSWSFFIASRKEGSAQIFEFSKNQLRVIRPETKALSLVHGNFFRSNLSHKEFSLSWTCSRDFRARPEQAHRMIEHLISKKDPSQTGAPGYRLSVPDVLKILGNRLDIDTETERLLGNVIAVVTTLSSYVYDPGQEALWMSTATQSPVSQGDFLKLPLDPSHLAKAFDQPTLASAQASTVYSEDTMDLFRKSYRAFHQEFDDAKTLALVNSLIEAVPTEACFWNAKAFLLLRQREHSSPKQALEAAREALHQIKGGIAYEEASRLLQAWCLDLLGNRQEALTNYQDLLTRASSVKVRRHLKKRLKTPFQLSDAHRVTFDFQYCDFFDFG